MASGRRTLSILMTISRASAVVIEPIVSEIVDGGVTTVFADPVQAWVKEDRRGEKEKFWVADWCWPPSL